MNTNIEGKRKVPFALRKIRGVGRRFAKMVTVKAGIDPTRRAGELTEDEIKKIIDIISKPLEYDLPKWVVNRKKDPKDGSYTQQVATKSATTRKLKKNNNNMFYQTSNRFNTDNVKNNKIPIIKINNNPNKFIEIERENIITN